MNTRRPRRGLNTVERTFQQFFRALVHHQVREFKKDNDDSRQGVLPFQLVIGPDWNFRWLRMGLGADFRMPKSPPLVLALPA
jgi:hypothetical protein